MGDRDMWTDAADVIRYIESNLKIKLDTEFNYKNETYEIIAKLILNNKVISEDKLSIESCA